MKPFENDCGYALETARQMPAGVAPVPSVRAHLKTCSACTAASALIRANALAAAPLQEMDELSRHRYIDGILKAAATPEAVSTPASKRGLLFAAGIAAVLAVLVGTFYLLRDNASIQLPSKVAAHTPQIKSEPPAESNSDSSRFAGNRFVAQSMPSVMLLPTDIEILLEPTGKLVLERVDRTDISVHLIAGELLAEVSPSRRGPKFQVTTAIGTVSVKGTVFNVQASEDSATVYVLRGAVEVETESTKQTVHAGEGFSLDQSTLVPLSTETRDRLTEKLARLRNGDTDAHMRVDLRHLLPDANGTSQTELPRKPAVSAAAPKRVPTVEALLEAAKTARRQKHWDAACDIYEELFRLYPDDPAAVHAKVTLGNLLLDKLGSPSKALDNFSRYLAEDNPPLAEEALYGKSRALRALGRVPEEKESLLEFTKRFPQAMKRREAEDRLRELENYQTSNMDQSP